MPFLIHESLRAALEAEGLAIVPVEPTPAMVKACKGALYRYITALPDEDRFRQRGKPGGLRVDQRTKVIVRWKAMVEAAREAEPGFKAAHLNGESGPAVTPDCPGSAPMGESP